MSRLHLSAIIISLIISSSCKNISTLNEDVSYLSFDYQTKTKLSEIISDIEYIRLETNDSCQIGSIKQILNHNNMFYILDAPIGKSIYMFTNEGKFIKKLNCVGQGPGEYAMPSYITINKKRNTLYINDIMQGKILVFNSKTFEFINEYPSSTEALSFCFLNDKNDIAWYNVSDIIHDDQTLPYHVITTDFNNSILNKMFPITFSTGYILRPTSPFFQTDTSTLFTHPYDGIVYKLFSDQTEKLLTINFQSHKFPSANYLKEIERTENFIINMQNSDYINYLETFETNENYCFNFFSENTYFMAIHNKINNKSIYFPVNNVINHNTLENVITDDIGILVFNNPLFCNNDSLYSLIMPHTIIEERNKRQGDINPKLQKITELINNEDNPILLKYKLK